MKRYLWISISCFLIAAYGVMLMSCGPSKNQLAAEQSFYNAKIAMSQRLSSQPIFEMLAADASQPIVLQNVSALRVYQLPANGGSDDLKQYQHIDYAAKWVGLIGTTVSVAAPWLGVWGVVHEVAGIAGTAAGSGNTTINTNGANNKTQVAGDMSITASTGNRGTVTIDTPTLINDESNSTHAPTVVEPSVVVVPPSYPPTTP